MTENLRRVSRALISVSDNTGVVAFARALAGHGIELISTGGTRKTLGDAGLNVRDVSDLTGFPEMMDGRVKTLHPAVHAGLLADLRDPGQAAQLAELSIAPFQLLVSSLYPFEQTVASGATDAEIIEQIDNQRSLELTFEQTKTNDANAVTDAEYNIQRLQRQVGRRQPLAAKGFESQEAADQSSVAAVLDSGSTITIFS